jgi:hypothetical protein
MSRLAPMRLRVLLPLLAVLFGVALAPAAAEARVPAGFVGMNLDGPVLSPQVNLARQLDLMVSSGVENLRVAVSWAQEQPYRSFSEVPAGERSQYQDIGGVPTRFTIDKLVGLAAARGLTILPVVTDTPAWADKYRGVGSSPPASAGQYTAFLAALIRRYGPGGSYWAAHLTIKPVPIRAWQIYNEPSFSRRWSEQPFASSYVALLRAAHDTVKRLDPGAKVVLAGLANYSWKALATIYAVPGARSLFDLVAIHPYTAAPHGVITILAYVRQVMDRAGDTRKPMLATELGWPSSLSQRGPHAPYETTEAGQASKTAALLPLLSANRGRLRLAGFDYYTWMGSEYRNAPATFHFSGLLRFQFNRIFAKPALSAFTSAALALERCRKKAANASRCVRTG